MKLGRIGIRGTIANWVKSFLMGRHQRVVVDGHRSQPRPVLSGVPQGTVLGPLLFLIYINDISENLSPGTTLKLFADDSLLYRRIKSKEDALILQKDLKILEHWERTWKMEFHPGKCQLLRITNKLKNTINANYYIHDTLIENADSAKYLGVTIDNKLKWKQQIENVCNKSNKVLGFLRRNLHSCPTHIKNQCYKALVRPILDYASCVWDPHLASDKENLEKVQKRAARFATNNYILEHGNTKLNMQKLGWEPLEERRAKNKLHFLYKAYHNLIDISLGGLSVNGRTRRGGWNFNIPSSNLNCHLYSFYPSSIRLWNLLSEDLKKIAVTTMYLKMDKVT